jgi:hypothetical protein
VTVNASGNATLTLSVRGDSSWQSGICPGFHPAQLSPAPRTEDASFRGKIESFIRESATGATPRICQQGCQPAAAEPKSAHTRNSRRAGRTGPKSSVHFPRGPRGRAKKVGVPFACLILPACDTCVADAESARRAQPGSY